MVCFSQPPTRDICISALLSIFPPHSLPHPPRHDFPFFFLVLHSQINLSHSVKNWSLIIDAIPRTSLTRPILVFFSTSISFSIRPALYFTVTHYKWRFFALLSYLVTSAAVWNNVLIGCCWHCWACCRIGAMHKKLGWERALCYHHSTDGTVRMDHKSITTVVSNHKDKLQCA